MLGELARAVDRAAPWVVGPVVAVLSIVLPVDGQADALADPWRALFAVACGVAAWAGRWHRWPLIVLGAAACVLFGQWHVLAAATYYMVTAATRRRFVPVYIAAATALVAARPLLTSTHGGGWSAQDMGADLIWAIVLPLVAGLWVGARRQVLAGLRERAERLEREQSARAEQARAQERTRIAREMHDVVAHRVSLIVLHAGALEVSVPDERTAAEIANIRATGREALANLREVLGVLRTVEPLDGHAPPPSLADLDRLLGQSTSAGLRVRRRDEGEPRPVSEAAQRAAYRVVQEALTNVHKHVGECDVEVVLRYRPDELEVVVDNGPPAGPRPADSLPGGGLGLLGLRERVSLLGGTLRTGRRPGGGFTVTARLPAEPVQESYGESVQESYGGLVGESVQEALGEVAEEPVEESCGERVGEEFGISVGRPVGKSVGEPVGASFGASVRGPAGVSDGEPVEEPVGVRIGDPIGGPVGVPVGKSVGEPVEESV
ncbi:histidine kinase [Nonomuraea sp. NN258]|nr:histidine kinase [Nonomuraea antri]